MNVRKATEADVPQIVDMAAKFYATTSYSEWADYCPESVEAIALTMMQTGVMLVAEEGETLVGMVGLVITPFLFNTAHKAAYEVVWWVDPEAQGRGAGKALLAAIEPACEGCSAIQMVHLHNSPPQAAAIYERMGFRHTESSFTKTLSEAN